MTIAKDNTQVKTFRYFNIMYAIALATIAVITILSQFFIQNHLDNQLNDSHVINVAGRQRMLSQKITKNCLLIDRGEWNKQLKQELLSNLSLWSSCHQILKSGELKLKDGSKSTNSPEIQQHFESIEKSFRKIFENAHKIIDERSQRYYSEVKISKLTERVLYHEYYFVNTMDHIVNQYDEEARDKVFNLKRIEYWLLAITLTTLLFEVMFIFQPVARRIRNVMNDLIISKTKANKAADRLNEINQELEIINRENRDINYALEKATVIIRTDEWGNILYANDKYSAITKYSRAELTGKKLFFNNWGEEESIIYQHINNEAVKNNVWQGEILDQAKDGTNFWLDVTMMPIEDQSGKLYQYLVICNDITGRKEAEQQLQKLNEQKLREQKDRQRIVSSAIITGQEKERKRMAIEIHDGVGQKLTALKFECEAILPANDEQKRDILNIQHTIYETIKEVRRISSNILPSALSEFGLGPAIREIVQTMSRSYDTKIVFNDRLNLKGRLNRNIEVSLYRITQEALNNALKHSHANLIQVFLYNTEDCLFLTVKDDGVGFDQDEVAHRSKEMNTGNGLTNMRERAELINAQLSVNSLPSLGVIVSVQLPLTEYCYE